MTGVRHTKEQKDSSIIIREYRRSDGAKVSKLFDRFQEYLISIDSFGVLVKPADYGGRYLKKTLKSVSNGKGKIYVAESKGEIIGIVAGLILGISNDPGVKPGIRGEITELYVDKTNRGKGVGTALMELMDVYFRSNKCKRVFVTVFAPNTEATEFYRKIGYGICDIDLMKKS
jgi:ribosomal protein S18 acetylase RimI-like enzyme